MYYEINVAKGKYHFFATSPRSIITFNTLRDVYAEIKAWFPEREGFSVQVSRVDTVGTGIDPSVLD